MGKKSNVTQKENTVKGDLAGRDINKSIYNIGRVTFGGKSQLELLYEKLEKERKNDTVFSEIIDELLHYRQQVKDEKVIGLEQKLKNGNRLKYLEFAEKTKEIFVKKLLKNEHSETAQAIYAFILAKIYSGFSTYVYPKIMEGQPDEIINQHISNFIIQPLEDLLGVNLLRIYEDEIYGMIYFLTGNCHIKWE